MADSSASFPDYRENLSEEDKAILAKIPPPNRVGVQYVLSPPDVRDGLEVTFLAVAWRTPAHGLVLMQGIEAGNKDHATIFLGDLVPMLDKQPVVSNIRAVLPKLATSFIDGAALWKVSASSGEDMRFFLYSKGGDAIAGVISFDSEKGAYDDPKVLWDAVLTRIVLSSDSYTKDSNYMEYTCIVPVSDTRVLVSVTIHRDRWYLIDMSGKRDTFLRMREFPEMAVVSERIDFFGTPAHIVYGYEDLSRRRPVSEQEPQEQRFVLGVFDAASGHKGRWIVKHSFVPREGCREEPIAITAVTHHASGMVLVSVYGLSSVFYHNIHRSCDAEEVGGETGMSKEEALKYYETGKPPKRPSVTVRLTSPKLAACYWRSEDGILMTTVLNLGGVAMSYAVHKRTERTDDLKMREFDVPSQIWWWARGNAERTNWTGAGNLSHVHVGDTHGFVFMRTRQELMVQSHDFDMDCVRDTP